ncbi:heavy metal-associated isoprenylated plant protein 9-like [Silene latifolia]|uniref:heavy metal-associated isoprenylated plant protein 9-like n=1 Tax=Silene latifolia TaxID=37657 RepID=UPI003D77B1FF
MGEEAKQEQAPIETKAEENKEENPAAPAPEEEKPPAEAETKADEPPQGPPPFILYVELHCAGCAKKIERSLMRIRGVEGVEIDMGQNQVSIKGMVEAEAVCNMIMKKTKRNVKILSPLPSNQGEPVPNLVSSQVSGYNTVELNVNMHCEACAGQLKKKILKMTGVQTVETELNTGNVRVSGTMDEKKLVDYVYRRTKKQARIVPQPEPEMPKPEETKLEEAKPEEVNEPEKPTEEPKPEEKTEEQQGGGEKPPEEPPNENIQGSSPNKEGGQVDNGDGGMVMNTPINIIEEESMKRSVMSNYNYTPNFYSYQPLYYIDTTPPPQLFSDENPNACCIT